VTDPGSKLHVGSGGARFEMGLNQKFSLGGNGDFEIDAPGVVGGRFVVRNDGRVHVGGNAIGGTPKLISFGDGSFVSIGENVADDRLELTAGTFVFTNRGGAGVGLVGMGRGPVANRLEVEGNASKTTAGDWLANSDRRIKKDIETITNALEKLVQVRLASFRYTDDYRDEHPSIEDRKYVNVIAQEFQQVFPESVKSSGDKLPDGDEILQVDTYPLTIYSAAAIQELNRKMAQNEVTLRKQLERRDAENAELKSRLSALEEVVAKLDRKGN
jgi:hypothetical protein